MSHMGLTVSVLVICDLIVICDCENRWLRSVVLGFTGCWLLLWG